MATPDRPPRRRPRLSATLPRATLPALRALSAATGVPQSKVVAAALASEIAERIARLTEPERAAYVAAGGVL